MNVSAEDNSAMSSLEDIEFLARSTHRVGMLEAVAKRPHDRNEIRELTGASSPTVGRMLCEFEGRRWITRNGSTYEVTPLGAFVAEGVTDLLARMATARKLREVAGWLSTDSLNFDLDCLADATISLPTRCDPLAPMKRASELERTAERSRVFTHALPSPCLDTHWRAILDGVHRFEAVLTPGVVETMAEPAHAPQFADLLASGQATVFVYEGDIPTVVGINDDVVYFGVDDEKGAPIALIETDDRTIRSWAADAFDSYKRTSSLLTVEAFAEVTDEEGAESVSIERDGEAVVARVERTIERSEGEPSSVDTDAVSP